MRDIYFTKVKGKVWCASQPRLLAEHFDIPLSENKDIQQYFTKQNIHSLHYKWTTDYTPYSGIHHLQPNHWLNLKTGEVKRFSLNFSSSIIPLHKVIEENAMLLTNIMQAAHRRFKLMLGCTAGYDSRVLLASCRQFASEAFFYIFLFNYMQGNEPDVRVPVQMFKALSLPYNVIKESLHPDEVFMTAYYQSSMFPRKATLPCLYHQYMKFPDYVNVSENTITIAKVYMDRLGKTDAVKLADAFHQPHHPFILEWLQNWINNAEPAFPSDRMDISDLYFWEVFLANLNSAGCTEQDIAVEELSPSNCRRFLLNCFAVHPQYHTEPHSYVFHRKLLELMWKELLRFPINPDWKFTLVYFLRKHNLYFKTMQMRKKLKSLRFR